jgi:hypothetical protein
MSFAATGCRYYEIDQEKIEKALELPPEPQHGEVWICESDDGVQGLFYIHNGELRTYRFPDGTYDGETFWHPIRKVGTWLE